MVILDIKKELGGGSFMIVVVIYINFLLFYTLPNLKLTTVFTNFFLKLH